jgi:RND family efflux transporter MFP subunit
VTDLSTDLASLKIDRERPPARRAWVRPVVVLAAVAGTIALGAWGYGQVEGYVFQTEVEVTEVREVSPAQASLTLTSTGYVVPQARSAVGARIPGRVLRVAVEEGQIVAAGDVLVELDANDQQAALASARSRVLTARANLATAEANLAEVLQQHERQRALVERGVAARSTAEDLGARAEALRAQVSAAQAAIRAAQAEVDIAAVGVDQTTIVAPIAGTVVSEPVRVGETVDPSGRAVVELADLSTMMVETDVPEARLHLVVVGGPAEIVLDAFPGRRIRGEVAEIGQQVDRAKATVTVKVRFVDGTEGVLPEMSARVSFLTEALDEALLALPDQIVVPESAVVERGEERAVFVIDDDVVSLTSVRLGEEMAGGFELLDGPRPGTKLVSNPPAELRDGQRVREAD